MEISGTKHIIRVDTNTSTACEFCTVRVGGEAFATGVNHYLDAHDCTLLHVGTVTDRDYEGNMWQHTVAILGTTDKPEPRAPLNLKVSFPR